MVNRIGNVLLFGLAILFLNSCAGLAVKEIQSYKIEKKREPLDLSMPTPLELQDVDWIIITKENADEVFKKMEAEGIDPVVFGLSDNDFQLLAKNFAQIRAHMMKLNVMIDEYKDYYESDVINNKELTEDKK